MHAIITKITTEERLKAKAPIQSTSVTEATQPARKPAASWARNPTRRLDAQEIENADGGHLHEPGERLHV